MNILIRKTLRGQLARKRILLVLEPDKRAGVESPNANFLMMLKRLYRKAKDTANEFKVIRVLIGNEKSSTINISFEVCLGWYHRRTIGYMPIYAKSFITNLLIN